MHRGHNTTYFRGARRRVDDIKISRGGGGGGIPSLPPPLAPMKYFSARRARPIKFRAAASRNNSRGSTRLPPFFRNLSPSPPPPFFGNVFKAPRAANRKRLCLARVTARPSLALDLSSWRTLLPISPFRGGFLSILLSSTAHFSPRQSPIPWN